MDALEIRGGTPLRGEVVVGGAKNAALPLIASALLSGGRNTFKNVPRLKDVETMAAVLAAMGAEVQGAGTRTAAFIR